ncbi:serine/threonine kinase 19 [Entomortierella parvispora]|uniref:Serine/threonine kinase 19 n=1 Tax=Entomortierella parvispora TaxID=205924 RepID=A0A9P3H6R3_9FUNG|nr:serine/threonine kinase 19 [Entomortierella parvispora]
MASRKPVSSTQQQRHQLLRQNPPAEGGGFIVEGETLAPTSRGGRQSAGSKSSSSAIASLPLPTDTSGAIDYLLELTRPHHVRQQKPFPRVCMVHQIYSLLKDHTTVDRTLAQMIKDGLIRKFYIGGTGSDEFAIMRTPDYVDQIMVAKEQYLKELEESSSATSLAVGSTTKRKLPEDNMSEPSTVIGNSNKRSSTVPRRSGARVGNGDGSGGRRGGTKSSEVLQAELEHAGDLFDRFRNLVTSGQCIEISIQHSNLQEAIGATEEDITVLIRYSLLTRCLAVPANPHLVNLNNATGRTAGSSASPGATTGGSGHSALNQLINATNQEQSRTVKVDVVSSSAAAASMASSGPGSNPSASIPTTPAAAASLNTISAASGRRERISDDVAYRFAIRQGGLFVTHFLKGRLEILRMIKRQMFGDMLTSAVIAKPLRGSFLPHEFHIHDLVGSGRVQSVTTTSGQLLKLTQKGEASAKAGTNKS